MLLGEFEIGLQLLGAFGVAGFDEGEEGVVQAEAGGAEGEVAVQAVLGAEEGDGFRVGFGVEGRGGVFAVLEELLGEFDFVEFGL